MNNLANRIAGPAIVTYKGQTFVSVGDIELDFQVEPFVIESSLGVTEERESIVRASVSFQPAGIWSAAALAVLYPYQTPIPGQSIVRVAEVTAVDQVDDELDIAAHPFRTGGPVRVFGIAGGTVPTGITEGDLYYPRAVNAGSISLHPTADDATNNTNKVDLTSAGTGRIRVVEQEPLAIQTQDGRKITFHVAAVTQQPSLTCSAVAQLFGTLSFGVYRKAGVAPTTDNSLYTEEASPWVEPEYDPAGVLTQAYAGAWGAAAPWDAFSSATGFALEFPVQLADLLDDELGLMGQRYVSGRATCTAQPTNLTEAALLAKQLAQGVGAGRGRRMSGDNLIITGTGVHVQLYGASLRNGPQRFGQSVDRIGVLNWEGARVYAAGNWSPLFYLGTAAPA